MREDIEMTPQEASKLDRIAEDVSEIKRDIAVQGNKLDTMQSRLDKVEASAVLHHEVEALKEDVKTIKGAIGWVIKGIIGAIITAGMALLLIRPGD